MTKLMPFKTKWEAIAFWTKMTRDMHRWSQDAVAVNGGISKKTVQRIEQGLSVDPDSLRGLARGLGEKPGYFEGSEWYEAIQQLFACMEKASEKVFLEDNPDHVMLDAAPLDTGLRTCQLIDESQARSFTCNEQLSADAQDLAANLFDFMRNLGDSLDEASFVKRRGYEQNLDVLFDDLKAASAKVTWATRSVTMKSFTEPSASVHSLKILYIHVQDVDHVYGKLMVARQIAFGF